MEAVSGSTEQEENEPTHSRITEPIFRILLAIRSSLLLFIATVGILFVVVGVTVMDGVLAGMFGIWGVSALVYAALGHLLLKAIGYH